MDEFLREFRAKYPGAYDDLTDEQLAQAVHKRFYDDMPFEAFLQAVNQKHGAIPPNEQAEQPPFATLPPMLGGALDALTAFGNYTLFGVPELIVPGMHERMEELREREPVGTALMVGAGIGATAGLGMLGAAQSGLLGNAAARAVSPTGFAITGAHLGTRAAQAAGSLGRGAMQAARPLAKPIAQAVGLGGGFALLNRILGFSGQ